MKIIICVIYLLTILIIISIYLIKKNKLKMKLPIILLRILLPNVCMGFFGQIFLLLSTLFHCENGHSYISEELKCRTGSWFIYHSPFAAVAMFLHCIIAFITITLYYNSFYISKTNVIQRTNTKADICFLFTKIIINLLFALDKKKESEHWVILFILIIVTGYNAYTQLFFKNRLNVELMILIIIFSLILFFGYFTLFIGQIFNNLGYNGSIFLYFLSLILIFVFFFILQKK